VNKLENHHHHNNNGNYNCTKLNNFSGIGTSDILNVRSNFGTPVYLYDEKMIIEKCEAALSMPSPYGMTVRYAMKANSGGALLRLIHKTGLSIDASSLNEAKRAHMAGIGYEHIILTTQEAPEGGDLTCIEQMMLKGLIYNVCSIRQLHLIGDFASRHNIGLSIRIHPGIGSGESPSRDTGNNYSCFGVHLSDLSEALDYAAKKEIRFTQVHNHIGSGGDPEIWRQNIDLELGIVERDFPDAVSISFGGGLKEARMPDEQAANIKSLGDYAKARIEAFYQRTSRKLRMEIEPGAFIVANAGYAVTKVIDKKNTGRDGFNFIITDGGMEINTRPLMYGSRHPFYIISKTGRLLFSEFHDDGAGAASPYMAVVVGRCCESGDSQCLDIDGINSPRSIVEPEIGDILVIGGVGAYCSSMSPFNYNSHEQIPEVLFKSDGSLRLIRKRQTLEQMVENEL
jgi:diaminopimelate decarboxylase